jgi:hypothetical protein
MGLKHQIDHNGDNPDPINKALNQYRLLAYLKEKIAGKWAH